MLFLLPFVRPVSCGSSWVGRDSTDRFPSKHPSGELLCASVTPGNHLADVRGLTAGPFSFLLPYFSRSVEGT